MTHQHWPSFRFNNISVLEGPYRQKFTGTILFPRFRHQFIQWVWAKMAGLFCPLPAPLLILKLFLKVALEL